MYMNKCMHSNYLRLAQYIAILAFVELMKNGRAAPIPGICIGIEPIPAIFDGIGIDQVSQYVIQLPVSIVCVLL